MKRKRDIYSISIIWWILQPKEMDASWQWWNQDRSITVKILMSSTDSCLTAMTDLEISWLQANHCVAYCVLCKVYSGNHWRSACLRLFKATRKANSRIWSRNAWKVDGKLSHWTDQHLTQRKMPLWWLKLTMSSSKELSQGSNTYCNYI